MPKIVEDKRSGDGGRRDTDCSGNDCPQFLKQGTKIESLSTGQKILIGFMVATLGFQGITYKSLNTFVSKYNDTKLLEVKAIGLHLVEMERIRQKQKTIEGRYKNLYTEFHKWKEKHENACANHLNEYHSP